MTRQLIQHLTIGATDDVVEFAPGLGGTARIALMGRPRSYIGIERDVAAAAQVHSALDAAGSRIVTASADATQLPSGSASVVYGEAMLSMQTPEQKHRIVVEAFRLLKRGGRYGIHEFALLQDDIDADARKAIEREMSLNIHVGVRPGTLVEWHHLLAGAGFRVEWHALAPMHLLEPKRMLGDEGVAGVLRILLNLLRKPSARQRVLSMRRMFRRHASHLSAVAIVCLKPAL